MDEASFERLLDLTYGAAANPALWAPLLESIADEVGGNSAYLSQVSFEDGSGSSVMTRIDPVMPLLYVEHYGSINPFAVKERPHEAAANFRPIIQTDLDVLPGSELTSTEYYNDFMRPQDVHGVLMADLALQGLNVVTVNINRSLKRGPFEQRDLEVAARLHPHLIRAFKLSSVFGNVMSRRDDAVAALDHVGQAILILDVVGRLQQANRQGEQLLAQGDALACRSGRIVTAREDKDGRLEAMIRAAASPDPLVRVGGSLAMTDRFGEPVLSVKVTPLHPERFNFLTSGPAVLLCITDLRANASIDDALLRRLFGLTAAEARVARLVLEGVSPRGAAERTGVSVNTVRTQLSRIYDKTRTSGQADLSKRLARLALYEDR